MEKVFPVEIKLPSPGMGLNSGSSVKSAAAGKQGVVEKILEPDRFIVTLADGAKVKVQGPVGLKIGDRVRISNPLPQAEDLSAAGFSKSSGGAELQGSVLMSLGFGGKDAKARLEIYAEKQSVGAWKKSQRAIYFVLVVQTQELGEVQWSIHMQDRNVTLQVFAPRRSEKPVEFQAMVKEVEASLRTRGFNLMAPTFFLNKVFKAPSSYRLNVRG